LPNAFTDITREQARRKLGLSDNDFFILSFGGSGGAEKLNQEVISLMKNHSAKSPKIKHVHATGKKYYDKIKDENPSFVRGYNGCKILPFIDEMALYMRGADTIISRCGAMTLSEVSICGCVPILIPSPNVTNNHQYKNAKLFTDNGAALMIEEQELNERTLLDAVRYLESNRSVRERMRRNLSAFKTENTKEIIIDTINGILKSK
jgi:UDP-N-acetylglucosamine--N-acetylmuramyl-(pentapeptide) pyrophosphoryl-undecaprenol N-acetylglucosamine transferase